MGKFLVTAAVFVLLVGQAGAAGPHVVIFIADDLGWADCSPYGGKEVPTPNMARLAKDGVTLTHAFVPGMLERKRGGVITVASTAGMQPLPYETVYSASKAFARALRVACSKDKRLARMLPSTKGLL